MTEQPLVVAELPHILLVTGNKGKLREIQAILEGVAIVENIPLDLPELQGSTTLEISSQKGREAFRLLHRPVLIEDTSLCFNGLKGLPGPYIKWFHDKLGCDGLVRMLEGFEDKTAYASCIFTYCTGAEEVRSFEGVCVGSVVKPRGSEGFGWDPIFEPAESAGQTFGEMSAEAKNKISHRSQALQLVKDFFLTQKGGKNGSVVSQDDSSPTAKKKLRVEP